MKMSKRSNKIAELKEKTESKCKWGLFSIFESCQGGRVGRKLISNGRRPSSQQIIEYPRKSDQFTRFDEECQRFQNEAYLAFDTKSRSKLNLVEEHAPVEKQTEKELKSLSELVDHRMESQRKVIPKAHRRKPSSSEETSLSEVTLAEVLRTVSPNDDNVVEPVMSEGLRRSFSVRRYRNVDEFNSKNQVVQMNVKALVDQMFIERRLKDRLNSECKSFSDALEVLSSTKNSLTHKKEREALKVRSAEEDSLKKSSLTARPRDDEVVILKPKSQNLKYHHSDSSVLQVQESDSFSFKKAKKRLKRRFIGLKGPGPFLTCGDSYVLPQNGSSVAEDGNNRLTYGAEFKSNMDLKTKEKLWKRPDLKKRDFQEFDVILEAKRHLSSRLKNVGASDSDGTCKRPPRTLGRILLSPERDYRSLSLSPKKESSVFSGSSEMRYSLSLPQVSKIIERQRTCLSPSRPNTDVFDREEIIPRTGEESHDTTGKSKTVITKSTRRQESDNSEAATEIKSSSYTISQAIVSQNDDNSTGHSISGSVSEHKASTSTASIIQHLDIADTIKFQEEHRSPVSVLEQIFTEEANSPPRTMSQTDKQELQPLCLDFEEQVYGSIPRDQPISQHYCIEEQDYISHYIQSVLKASCLNWDYLSEIELQPEEPQLLAESLFDEVEIPLADHCYFDPKLLFDRINEVLLQLYEVYCCPPPWLAFQKPRIRQVELEKAVIDEVMNEAEFFLLPRTERRTLDQLVSKDVRKCRSWLDVTRDREQIVTDISDDVLEESIVDILLGFEETS